MGRLSENGTDNYVGIPETQGMSRNIMVYGSPYICSDRSAMMREMKNMRQNGLIDADGRKITLLLD